MSNHAPKVDPISWLLFIASAVAILLTVYLLVTSLINTINKNSTKGEIDSTSLVAAASDNLKPIGASATSDSKPAAPVAARSGKEVYDTVCTTCHATGVAGAPKIDDKAAWEPRIATGFDALMATAINGKGAMPARGGNPSVTDAELKATIIYMAKEAGFDLGVAEDPVATEAPAKAEEKSVATDAEPVKVNAQEETKKEEALVVKEPSLNEEPKAKEEPAAPAAPAQPDTPAIEAPAKKVVAASASAVDLEKGKAVYSKSCFACHATGVAGSPKLDDKAAWAPRITTGIEALYGTALNGKGAMPPKGGAMSLSDEDVKAAVDYMVSEAK